ncbi:MAG: 4Fe-4S double cluster binding domain-containing protein, partial [Planctomycetota bacterium]
SFRACVDTAPVLEREHAQRAGVGAVGKHTLLIDRGVGSYLLLGEVLTTMEIAPSPASEPDPCGSCQRCIDACPTDAITPFAVDARRCISYLTIEHRSIIDEQFHAAIGDWLFGCDICQDVCPHNQATDRTTAAPVHDIYAPQRSGFDVLDVLGWTEDDRRLAFIRSALKRAKLGMMKRNALIVGANLLERMTPEERAQYAERVERLQCDVTEEDIVRETARQIAARL